MHASKRLTATLAVAAALTAAAPAAANAAAGPVPANFDPPANVCLHDVGDMSALGPYGPYGPSGPWGKDGPMNGKPNPLGDVANCGGMITYIVRGGTLDGFIQANIGAVGIHAPGQ